MPGLLSRRVMVMRFVDGIKLKDLAALDKHSINRELIVGRIMKAYAHQIYRNGFFNAGMLCRMKLLF
jgi:aarF domain-containing kinase